MIHPDIRIASQCSADWNKMQGDDRVRHCADCNLNVYNFSAMTDLEVERLIAKTQGRLCARIYRRTDGTILTQNCPVGLRARIKKISRIAGAALSAAMSVTFVAAQTKTPQKSVVVKSEKQASLKVTVLDRAGSFIPNTKIVLENISSHKQFVGATDANGILSFSELPTGEYQLNAQYPGFATSQKNLILHANEIKKFDIALKVEINEHALMGEVVFLPPLELDTSDIPSKITK